MQDDLFTGNNQPQQFGATAYYLPGFVEQSAPSIIEAVRSCVRQAPLRHFSTPGGRKMSVLSSNCGEYGWVSDNKGYRYQQLDPVTERPWPEMPQVIKKAAIAAAKDCGFSQFEPDACLINVYSAGAAMGLHQDKDESDFSQPIVSFSFGLPVTFLWGGSRRTTKPAKIELKHGDTLVWGGESRLHFHGVKTLAEGHHPLTSNVRINLTLRKR